VENIIVGIVLNGGLRRLVPRRGLLAWRLLACSTENRRHDHKLHEDAPAQ
jgi:hypothetical protein